MKQLSRIKTAVESIIGSLRAVALRAGDLRAGLRAGFASTCTFVAITLVAITLVAALPLTAQSQGLTRVPCPPLRTYAVKVAPAAIMFGKVSLGGEYVYSERQSLTFYLGIPFNKSANVSFDEDNSVVNSRTFSIMGGYRYYLKKQNMKGFYIEPFLKYLKNTGSGELEGTLGPKKVLLDYNSDYSGIGLGAQLGVQFLLGKKLILDWFLLGPEMNSGKINSSFRDITSSDWSEQDAIEIEEDIRDVLSDVPMIGKKIDVAVNASTKTVTGKYSGLLPGIRSGISLGYRF